MYVDNKVMKRPFKVVNIKLNDVQIAWLAGLLEGEASFGIDARSSLRYKNSTCPPAPTIQLSMVDEDVIAKVAKMLCKDYFCPNRKTVTGKQVYKISIQSRPILTYLLPLLLPHLSQRRVIQVNRQIDLLNQYKTWCEKGDL